ncbi:MAG: type II toxin-antitoxin system VapC family toxin [Caulobacter sp.]|nr:type II toxin-antitoxin system VapC family toxin [Caulobacter sp.]
MSGVLVDSSVLIDLVSRDPQWSAWSRARVAELRLAGPLWINQIVYAECRIAFRRSDSNALDRQDMLGRQDLPWEAAAMAGEAHAEYRRRGGAREAILPDFLIGAHAAFAGYRLLTRDPRRVRTAFPALEIIAPDGL